MGSFLNCVIYRLEKGKSFLKGRSFCPKCQHILSWQDLVPLLSFIVLRGKCRYCHKKISWQYPVVEIATGGLFLISYFLFLNHFLFLVFYWVIFSLLIVIFVYDLKHYIIPDKVVLPFGILVILGRAYEYLFNVFLLKRDLGISAVGLHWHWFFALATFIFFFLIWFFSKGRAMGFGDVKLIFPLMLILGWPFGLVGLFIAFIGGSVVGLALIAVGKKKMSSQVPFGPFLIGGAFVALFWGNMLWRWYLSIFNYG